MIDSETAPAVTVITPAFNTATYLPEAIQSVQSQTLPDWEMVIVDDGSTDTTRAVAQAAAAADPRIRVISIANQGQAAARNVAVRQARAPLLALLDSDDLWHPEFLAEQKAVLDSHPEVAIVSANATNLGGVHDGLRFWPQADGLRCLTTLDIVLHENAVCVMSMFRRSVFDTIGGFDARFTGNEDYQFWLRASVAGFVVAQHFKVLAAYRRRDGSSSSDERKMLRGAIDLLEHARRTYVRDAGIRDAIGSQVGIYRERLVTAEFRARLRRWHVLPLVRALRIQRQLRNVAKSVAAWGH